MKVYLVGGAVRDSLLSKPIKEKDWVVVGSTPEEMIAKGFRPIGKDFPVFLHPKTHEEYALARTERKTAKGYRGFEFYTSPDITLEEDLRRRDLTINAIAQDKAGQLIDPFHGEKDLKAKIFRHVSSAFEEDPVRLLRVCRFSAKLPGFGIAQETLTLLKKMVALGEVDALVPERVWQELEKALGEKKPYLFFHVNNKTNAFSRIFKEVSDISILKPLEAACQLSRDKTIRFAAAFGQLNAEKAKQLCQRLRIPNEYADLLQLVCRHYSSIKDITCDAKMVLGALEKLDPFRRSERFDKFLMACQAIDETLHENPNPNLATLKQAYDVCKDIKLSDQDRALPGSEIAAILHNKRWEAINNKPA